ncbi:MBOAT family O-acyltransferase [Clostridium saccharoperbutylacetonicum]|uniref:Membrane bound O-acyl transferase MBOAT family protein n=1 Tax=Clostridium saccharoperbutylacetonicum N1-4(HMT) TaxID=931276 RepID=M1M0J8_9CLOT|nr:MBOAT family protein [Clostridium saccharoperbutylacetonicum]AGF59105.1 membrane bound O-acyl transferase MBOAT family protein [Clostridium saccharoperbutylacetonicum N1-4(HMT)]AQR97774.1 peptidoglycan O-acetyltransferase [Clostridium saccharoperbutylacetonicum]NRT60107.1 alginate O-acetyltransferase complex protein AlgI [Clostridium saccharoperbutylacetonicum]NSB23419.1 alginate O-acetyltransferase complex protein AlgI [Clostridium saccharoperbutylacetonicum]NSB33662.1 alginate O-acetyltra
MIFSTTLFLFIFLPLTLLIYYLPIFKNKTLKNIILFIASIIFYAWGEPTFVLILLFSIIVTWLLGLLVDKYRSTKMVTFILVITVIFNIGLLFFFKYLNFTIDNLNSLLGLHISNPRIQLPLGISFFTFQALSYVIDVYRKKIDAQKNLLNIGLYLAFFPKLAQGPIVRYETIAQEISNRKENLTDFSEGIMRFIQGLGKKVLIANNLALVADYSFQLAAAPGNNLSVSLAWLGAIAYTFQIFFDFSGYSDMAIGLGRMFGFHFLENFNYPYISKSVSEFWRRWHISLQTWFRDYIYIPLGGNRVSNLKFLFNIFIIWLLTGIWHGANWTFILWGLMYFVLLAAEKFTGFNKKLKGFGYVYTLFFVMIGWVIFRSDNISIAIEYIKIMFGIGANGILDNQFILYLSEFKYYFIAAILCSVPLKDWLSPKFKFDGIIYNTIYCVWYVLILFISISFLVKGAYNPFIYFKF